MVQEASHFVFGSRTWRPVVSSPSNLLSPRAEMRKKERASPRVAVEADLVVCSTAFLSPLQRKILVVPRR